jgi:HAD superfamily hydrolase (TIGR01509 family)
MGRFRALILDLDGTVVDSHRYTFDAFQHACTPHRQPPSDAEVFAAFGPSERIILAQLLRPAEVEPAYGRLQEHYQRHAAGVAVHPEMRALLGALRRHGIGCGLFTGRGGDSTRLLLATLHLESCFDAVVAGDEIERPKPHPEGVRRLLGALGCEPREALLVGDSRLDLEAARAAGVPARFATWHAWTGHAPPEDADIVTRPRELREILGLPPSGDRLSDPGS